MPPARTPSPSWQRAASFAARAHERQHRKDKSTPYVAHPFRVAMTVRHVFGIDDEVALCVALLHDTIEDTTTDFDDLAKEFGDEVAEGVAFLTKDNRLPEHRREPIFHDEIAKAPWNVRVVKLADSYDNVSEADEPKVLGKALEKARHVLSVVGEDDPRLARAKDALRKLLTERTPAGGTG